VIRQLLSDGGLEAREWNPDDDRKDDGILLADPWRLDKEGSRWSDLTADGRVEQAAAFVKADLDTIKQLENDYTHYRSHVGPEYEAIFPVSGSHYRGTDPRGNDFATLRLFFECDLPFPFGSYKADVRILNWIDDRGRFVTDIYSDSDDFNWFVGRDVFLPVETSAGEPVGWVVVRLFGFDIDNVPDKPDHRQAALRSSLGNLKRKAERRFREASFEIDDVEPKVPDFRVLGRR